MVSTVTVMGMVFTMLVCTIAPLLTLAFLKSRKRAPILYFVIGIVMHLLFVMVAERFFLDVVLSSAPGIAQDPILHSFLEALFVLVFEGGEFALILHIFRENIVRGSRPLQFAAGHSFSNAVLSSGLSNITYFTVANMVSTQGREFMTQGLSGAELDSMNSMLDYVQGDFLPFYLDGVNQLSMMFLYGCLAVLLWMAMSSRLPRWWAAVALGAFFLQRLVLSLGNNGALSPLWMVSAIALGLMIIAVVVTRQIYLKKEGTHSDMEDGVRRLPMRH